VIKVLTPHFLVCKVINVLSSFSITTNVPPIAAGGFPTGQISRFWFLSSFAVQDYEKAVNKANSAAGQAPLAAMCCACCATNSQM
jgi:hypothetical protein